jgi:hypothetical protein
MVIEDLPILDDWKGKPVIELAEIEYCTVMHKKALYVIGVQQFGRRDFLVARDEEKENTPGLSM